MSVPPAGDAMEPGAAELYDQALLGILQHVGNVQDFLRVLFGFLYRKTDFYRLLRHPSDRMGFPPGAAQALVLQVTRGGQAAPGGVGGAVAARPRRPPARPPLPPAESPWLLNPAGAEEPREPPLSALPASVHPLALGPASLGRGFTREADGISDYSCGRGASARVAWSDTGCTWASEAVDAQGPGVSCSA